MFGTKYIVSVSCEGTIADFKSALHESSNGPPPDAQRLLFNQKPLEDESKRLSECGLKDGTLVSLTLQDEVEGAARRKARERAINVERIERGQREQQQQQREQQLAVAAAEPALAPSGTTPGSIQQPLLAPRSTHNGKIFWTAACRFMWHGTTPFNFSENNRRRIALILCRNSRGVYTISKRSSVAALVDIVLDIPRELNASR
eukprot:COSAG02_NODE_349_length_24073_cov_102.816092_5_plen_203_part_00